MCQWRGHMPVAQPLSLKPPQGPPVPLMSMAAHPLMVRTLTGDSSLPDHTIVVSAAALPCPALQLHARPP